MFVVLCVFDVQDGWLQVRYYALLRINAVAAALAMITVVV